MKRKFWMPVYISEQLADLALLSNGWYGNGRGRSILRRSMRAASKRFRDYSGPEVYLYATVDGYISAEFELTASGYQHEDEIL